MLAYYAPTPNRRGIERCFCLISVCLSHTSGLSREQRPRKTKIGTKLAYVTRDSGTTFKVKRSKVKVTRPLCSPPCWRVRRLQRWAWEHVGRVKLLLRCRLLGGARRFGARGGGGAGTYRGGRPPTACYIKTGVRPRASFKETAGYRRQRRRCRQPETSFLIPVTCPLVDHTVTGKKSLME